MPLRPTLLHPLIDDSLLRQKLVDLESRIRQTIAGIESRLAELEARFDKER